jgi:hypothetical protein
MPRLQHRDFDSILHFPPSAPGAAQVHAPCHVLSFRGNRLALLTDRDIPLCLPLTVEHEDALYLGEVVKSCSPQADIDVSQDQSEYQVEIHVEQVLSGLQSLVSLRARLLDEQARADERLGEQAPRENRLEGTLSMPVRKRRA